MTNFTKERLIEELKSSTQNASGMFEISEDTICALMSMLTYAAPQLPQPAVPETLPCPVMLEPGLRFGKGIRTQTMLDALQVRAEYYACLEAMTPEQRADHDAGMKEFTAMFQGKAELPAYEIKRFGEFCAKGLGMADGESAISIQFFDFECSTATEPERRGGIVEKYALQAIINALQQQCDRLSDAPIPVIGPAAPQQEVKK